MIDARAIISPQAQLAAGVHVGPYSIIGPDVVIGERTWIGPHAVINGPTRIGADNKFFQFTSIGDAPQDKKYAGEPTRLEIGDRNVFREFCTVNRGTTHDRGVTTIGSDNLFMAYTHVAHDCTLGNNIVMANCATLGGHVQMGDWAFMGGLSAAHQFSKIGAHAFIANNAAVTRDVPPFIMAVGQPAEPHHINSVGLSRRGFTEQQISHIKQAYRILYRQNLKLDEALVRIEKLAKEEPALTGFVEFIRQSSRSIVR
jgi:UDP-N-acetylglucosamine acyltransferase